MLAPLCACGCGRRVPRDHENWRYDTYSNECLKRTIEVEREASLRLKAAKKMPVQLELFPIVAIPVKIKKTAQRKAA